MGVAETVSTSKVKRGELLEREIEAYLVERVEALGGMCLKLKDTGRVGFPDRTVIWPAYGFARVHFVELKTIGGGYERGQEQYHKDLRKRNATVFTLWTKAQIDGYISEYAPVPF